MILDRIIVTQECLNVNLDCKEVDNFVQFESWRRSMVEALTEIHEWLARLPDKPPGERTVGEERAVQLALDRPMAFWLKLLSDESEGAVAEQLELFSEREDVAKCLEQVNILR